MSSFTQAVDGIKAVDFEAIFIGKGWTPCSLQTSRRIFRPKMSKMLPTKLEFISTKGLVRSFIPSMSSGVQLL
jgi:hypothetical protein